MGGNVLKCKTQERAPCLPTPSQRMVGVTVVTSHSHIIGAVVAYCQTLPQGVQVYPKAHTLSGETVIDTDDVLVQPHLLL